jgi:predicted nucleotidyltransferase
MNLTELIMKLKQLLQEKREEILKIAAKHGADNVRIFGSVARGEDDEKSDIDFLIDYDVTKISPWFPSGLMQDLQSILGRKVDIATVDGLKERIRERVLQEAIKL